jgi:predicted DNA-binding transcriptional regulator AlpA
MLSFDDLASVKGISFHRNYLRSLWEHGQFPEPIKLSARKLAWREDEVDSWLLDRMAAARRGGR